MNGPAGSQGSTGACGARFAARYHQIGGFGVCWSYAARTSLNAFRCRGVGTYIRLLSFINVISSFPVPYIWL